MSDAPKPTHVTCNIDGVDVKVPVNTNLVEAALAAGIEIPFYCYHKGLSIAANCRMCLVEVSNAPPGKLVPACQTPAVEGQKVQTASPRVKEQQRAVLEFLLLNHPVDCAICDQAGECKLQDYYMGYDHRASRLDAPKWLREKRKVLGPTIVIDQERCILCTRCVRFMDEVAKEPVLGVFGRGNREVVDVFPGKELTSNYAGNTVDICPVGALLSRDYRFRARSYFLTATPSVCAGCSRGCNTYLDHFQGVPYRYRPRENMDVNRYWMCDIGRISYHALYLDRADQVRVGRGEAAHPATAPEAARAAARALSGARGSVALVISPTVSVEDALLAMMVGKEGLGAAEVFVTGRPQDRGDALLLREDRNPNRKGVELAAQGHGLPVRSAADLKAALQAGRYHAALVLGHELPQDAAGISAALAKLDACVVLAANGGQVADAASVLLPLATHAETEGTFVNFEGRFQRFLPAYPPRGQVRGGWSWLSAIAVELNLVPSALPTAREAWKALSPRLPAGSTGDFDWDRVPRTTAKGVTPLPGGTVDGRPPGWRELIPLKSTAQRTTAT